MHLSVPAIQNNDLTSKGYVFCAIPFAGVPEYERNEFSCRNLTAFKEPEDSTESGPYEVRQRFLLTECTEYILTNITF